MENLINTTDAISITKTYGISISRTSIINWCNKYNIGKKIAGRYLISEVKLLSLLKNDSKQL
jgi:hypothetical protein